MALRKILSALGISADEILELSPEGRPDEFVFVKELDVRLAAGGGSMVEHESVAREFPFFREWWNREIRRVPDHVRLVHVDGHSMEPLLSHRDAVLVDTQDCYPRSGRIFAVVLPDGSAVKEIQVTESELEVWERFPRRQKIYAVRQGDPRAERLIRGRVLFHRSGEGMFQTFDVIMGTIEREYRQKIETEWRQVRPQVETA